MIRKMYILAEFFFIFSMCRPRAFLRLLIKQIDAKCVLRVHIRRWQRRVGCQGHGRTGGGVMRQRRGGGGGKSRKGNNENAWLMNYLRCGV